VFMQLALLEMGVAPLIAMFAGLGLATGSAFWFAATIAEVYALHGAVVTAMIWALLRWRRCGQSRWFFAAIAAFSIGLGHHTSIVTIGPAVAVFAIAVAPRFALRPTTVAAILSLFALGFSQYLFVLVRTRQGAWGESPASNVAELFDIVRGARWTAYVAPITLNTIITRTPGVLSILAREVSPTVVAAALAGLVVMSRRDRPALCLVVGGMAGVLGFSIFFSGQTEGFLQPAVVLLWVLAAVGLDRLARVDSRIERYSISGAALLLAAVAAWHLSTNLEARDLSHRRFDMRYFDALSQQLPSHSVLLAEDFLVDRMVLYEKLGESRFDDRDIATPVAASAESVRAYSARGYNVFAFAKTAALLRMEGLEFDQAMWPLEYGSLRRYLEDQPRGTVVAIAIPALRLGAVIAEGAAPLDVIGGHIPLPSWSNLAAIGVVGGPAALQSEAEKAHTSVFAGRSLAIGDTAVTSPTDILAEAVDDRATIRVGAREIIGSQQPVVALWSPHGAFINAFALNAAQRVPMPDSPLSVRRLRTIKTLVPVGPSSTDLTAEGGSGHVVIRQPAGVPPIVIYAGRRARALAPRVFAGPVPVEPLSIQEFTAGSRELSDALTRDGVVVDTGLRSAVHIDRIELPRPAGTYHLGFGGIPDVVLARASSGEPASVFGLDLSDQLEPIDGNTRRLHIARDHHQLFLASGWSPVSADETGGFAITTLADAEVLLPCAPGVCGTVTFQMWSDREGDAVALEVNGTRLPAQSLHPDWHSYRWDLPPDSIKMGMNSFVLKPDRPARLGDVWVASGAKAR